MSGPSPQLLVTLASSLSLSYNSNEVLDSAGQYICTQALGALSKLVDMGYLRKAVPDAAQIVARTMSLFVQNSYSDDDSSSSVHTSSPTSSPTSGGQKNDKSNSNSNSNSNSRFILVLPVLFYEYLALSITKSIIPSMIISSFG
jgi:hypothetical protein